MGENYFQMGDTVYNMSDIVRRIQKLEESREHFTEGWKRAIMLRLDELERESGRRPTYAEMRAAIAADDPAEFLHDLQHAHAEGMKGYPKVEQFFATHPVDRGDELVPVPFPRPGIVTCWNCKAQQYPDQALPFCGNCGKRIFPEKPAETTLPPPCSPSSEPPSSSSSSKAGPTEPPKTDAICACGYTGIGPHITGAKCTLVCWCGGHASKEAVILCKCPCHVGKVIEKGWGT